MNEEEEREEMHHCEMKGQYITVRTAIIAVFATITPITTILSYYVSSSNNQLNSQIQLQLLPIVEKSKQNELRIVRLENSQLQTQKARKKRLIYCAKLKQI